MSWILFPAIIGAYLLGSLNFASLVAQTQSVDIRSVGSGNPGTSNVLRNLGWFSAAMTLVGDLFKGLIAAAAGWMLYVLSGNGSLDSEENWVWVMALGLAVVIGHCFPVFARFRGGKGVATAFGVLLWVSPIWTLVLLIAWGLVVWLTKTAALGSLVAISGSLPLFWWRADLGSSALWLLAAMVGLIWIRHYSNLVRLWRREEATIIPSQISEEANEPG